MGVTRFLRDSRLHTTVTVSINATTMTTVLIDNYDSFTWNVYQYLCLLGADVIVLRNDQTTLQHIISLNPRNLVISPGPGHPSDTAGISSPAISHFAGKIPILGVCLGEQCIFELYGGKVTHAGEINHGKTSPIGHDGRGIYTNVPQGVLVTRYHSLAGDPATVPSSLEVTSWTENGIIQGIRHKRFTVTGVQFHPESIMSEHGKTMLKNFLLLNGGLWDDNAGFGLDVTSKATKVRPMFAPPKGVPVRGAFESNDTSTHGDGSILTRIHAKRLLDIAESKAQPGNSADDLRKLLSLNIAPPAIDFYARLERASKVGQPAIIGEVKRASPSKGDIDLLANAAEKALAYGQAGAAAVSILTEPNWFRGTLADLRQARDAVALLPDRPAILRKDFIVDSYQVMESRLAGADTLLLIVAILADAELKSLIAASRSLGMEPLVEVNSIDEMSRAISLGARVIGVNNRNLHTFDVDMSTTSRLAYMVPEGVILTALSGITCRNDVIVYANEGVRAVLVGEAIMRSKDEKAFIRQLQGSALPTQPDTACSGKLAHKPLVKICGVNTVDAAIAATEAGADFIGMIFAKSRRQVDLKTAGDIIAAVRSRFNEFSDDAIAAGDSMDENLGWFQYNASLIRPRSKAQSSGPPLIVGVFQDQPIPYVATVARLLRLDLVQLHGDESLDAVRLIPVPCIKAFHVDPSSPETTAAELARARQPGYHAYALLDTVISPASTSPGSTSATQKGGSGISFNWSLARDLSSASPFSASSDFALLSSTPRKAETPSPSANEFPLILAGGLNPENVQEAIRAANPWAVDVSSGVESNGEKDVNKIKAFIEAVKGAGTGEGAR